MNPEQQITLTEDELVIIQRALSLHYSSILAGLEFEPSPATHKQLQDKIIKLLEIDRISKNDKA